MKIMDIMDGLNIQMEIMKELNKRDFSLHKVFKLEQEYDRLKRISESHPQYDDEIHIFPQYVDNSEKIKHIKGEEDERE